MANVKKIILFLFGIILIVFGNKAAINTIFKAEKELDKQKAEKEVEPFLDIVTRTLPSEKTDSGEQAQREVSSQTEPTEKPKPSKPEIAKEIKKEEPPKPTAVIESPITVVEGEKAEPATATE